MAGVVVGRREAPRRVAVVSTDNRRNQIPVESSLGLSYPPPRSRDLLLYHPTNTDFPFLHYRPLRGPNTRSMDERESRQRVG